MGRPTPDSFVPPPLPPSYEPTATPPWNPPLPPPSSSPLADFFAFLLILCFFLTPVILIARCRAREEDRENRDRPEEEAAAAAAPPPHALPRLPPSRHYRELHPRQSRAANPAALRLPAFKYSRPQNLATGGGDNQEAAACPVCLGEFQDGEIVRLLPVCLHRYHVKCIDPWLDVHSTCPICRSNTVVPVPAPTIDASQLRLIFPGR